MSAVADPTYMSIPMEINVNRPAAEVWKRVGKYCDIGEWLRIPCTITSGKDGEVGAVRSVASEVLVGKTELSYTYTQPVREGRPYNLYHGTLEARPVTATTSKLVYTLIFDNSMLADDAAREATSAANDAVHAGAREHEDPRRRRHAGPAAPPGTASAVPAPTVDPAARPRGPRVYVTNERSGNMTVIDANTNQAIATIALGKRPRGIRLAPDGKTLYVALSGSPIAGRVWRTKAPCRRRIGRRTASVCSIRRK